MIRKLKLEDAESLSVLANNKKIWDNVRDFFPHPYTLENAKAFINQMSGSKDDHVFAIIREGNLVGVVGIHPLKDIYRFTAEIGYWIGEPYWGKGYASGAVMEAVEYAWNHTKLERLEAGVFSYNPASMKILEKCGFHKEAVKLSRITKNGKIYDEHFYAITRQKQAIEN